MKRISFILLITSLLLAPAAALQAQEGGLELDLRRDFGYGMGGDIQGKFTLSASGPDDLTEVAFLIDEDIVFVAEEAPFRYVFHTGDYELGTHVLTAEGTLDDGTVVYARQLTLNFVSAEMGLKSAGSAIIPLLIIIALMSLLGVGLPLLEGRRGKPFEVGRYGGAGGAVCPRCGFPYSRHVAAMNLLVGKLERCPHCGKWAVVPGASQADLQAAEERYLADRDKGRMTGASEADDLDRLIDESRFES